MLNTLEELINLIRDRKKSSNEDSYTKKLLDDKKSPPVDLIIVTENGYTPLKISERVVDR